MNPERAWETLLSRLREARHPACERLCAARLLPSENGVFRVALASADDLNTLAGIEARLGVVLEDILHRPVQVQFCEPDTASEQEPTKDADMQFSVPNTPILHRQVTVSVETLVMGLLSLLTEGNLPPSLAGKILCVRNPKDRWAIVCDHDRSGVDARVLEYLENCVISPTGWTWPMTQGQIAQALGSNRSRVRESLRDAIHKGLILETRKDRNNPRLTAYRMAGVMYLPEGMWTKTDHIMDQNGPPEGGMWTKTVHLLKSLVGVIDSFREQDQQQQDSETQGGPKRSTRGGMWTKTDHMRPSWAI